MMRLTEWIDHHAGATPGKTAIRFGSQDISYAALAQKVERLASALAAAGVRRKSCVAWLGYNSPELLALLFACARLGAMFMPLNWRLAAPEHKQMLEDCPPAVLFVEPDFVAQTESIPCPNSAICAASSWAGPPRGLAGVGMPFSAARHRSRASLGKPTRRHLFWICYTSGSTGKPKGRCATPSTSSPKMSSGVPPISAGSRGTPTSLMVLWHAVRRRWCSRACRPTRMLVGSGK